MKILNNVVINPAETDNYKLYVNNMNEAELIFKNIKPEGWQNGGYMNDTINYIYYVEKFLKNINKSKVLIAGLGLGLHAFYLQSKFEKIDIVEIDIELIEIIKNQNYLLDNVSIINSDIYSYTTEKVYDMIIIDIFWNIYGKYENDKNILLSKFQNNLSNNGIIYFQLCGNYHDKNLNRFNVLDL